MPRYNRDDYSACDWKVSKSDILRCKRSIDKQRRMNAATLLGIVLVCIVSLVTLHAIYTSVKTTGATIKAGK
jgi:hypothetical protein